VDWQRADRTGPEEDGLTIAQPPTHTELVQRGPVRRGVFESPTRHLPRGGGCAMGCAVDAELKVAEGLRAGPLPAELVA
jgi:hypothetical protein